MSTPRVVFLGLLLAGAAGCGEVGQAPPQARVVADDAGREVRLAAPPERIVCLVPSVTDWLVAAGAAGRLVARTAYDAHPELRDLPSVGGGLTPSLEWLSARRPDLVIAWPDEGSRSVVQRLSELGVPVYTARFETLAEARATVRRLALLLDLEQQVEELLGSAEAELEALAAELAGLPAPRVFWVIALDPPTAAAGGTFVDEVLRLAGGENVFGDLSGWPVVSVEEVLQRQPDVVVLSLGGRDAAADRLRLLAGWRELAAVRGGRVHVVDPAVFHRPGPRVPWMARRLASLLHADPDAPAAFRSMTGRDR